MNRHISSLAVLLMLLLYLASVGCQQASPPKPEEKREEASMVPTPEEARIALITLTEKIGGAITAADGREIEKALASKERLKSLREDKITNENEYTFIGGWTCKLKEKKCFAVVSWNSGAEYMIDGRLERSDAGEWKVTISGVTHAKHSKK